MKKQLLSTFSALLLAGISFAQPKQKTAKAGQSSNTKRNGGYDEGNAGSNG